MAVAITIGAWLVGMRILPLHRVDAHDFGPREHWKAAASIAEERLCPGGRVYSNVPASYFDGVTFYARELEPRATYLVQHGQNQPGAVSPVPWWVVQLTGGRDSDATLRAGRGNVAKPPRFPESEPSEHATGT